MKSLIKLLQVVIREFGDICSVNTSLDCLTVQARFENEGFSHLGIVLPSLGQGLEQALDRGYYSNDLAPSFAVRGELPEFLGGFFELVFNREDGVLLDDPNIDAIRAIRQITLMFGKVRGDVSGPREEAALDAFVKCELENHKWTVDDRLLAQVVYTARMLFAGLFSKMENDIANWGLNPKHGPGSTADRVQANAKYEFKTWTERLEEVAPYWRYATPRAYRTERYGGVVFYEPGTEPPCRVVLVPKTVKTPRVIALEPTHMQFMQQGLLDSFVRHLQTENVLNNLISPLDQTPNQRMAQQGSLNGELATLDLSEASDRVLNSVVMAIVSDFPHLRDALSASRSQTADVPGRGIIPLAKFASMGSAMCFPIQMVVFLTAIFVADAIANDTVPTKRRVKARIGRVRVYGDDLIVPADLAVPVSHVLSSLGLRVNRHKSFWNGNFRESCGKEYFDGHDVSLTRVRYQVPLSREDVHELVSFSETRNQFYKQGLWKTVAWFDELIESIIPYPALSEVSDGIGKVSFLAIEGTKLCPHLHRPMVKGMRMVSTSRDSHLEGDGALMKFFLKTGDQPIFAKDHLEHEGRPVSFQLKYGWIYVV